MDFKMANNHLNRPGIDQKLANNNEETQNFKKIEEIKLTDSSIMAND
jgi:hypothetical protein